MTDKDQPYNGPDNRKEHRRKGTERRKEIRFEPDKDDRRQKPGRRVEDKDPWFRHGD